MNSEEELSDFCVAMMFAGHDTTLCSIQSCLHWLKACPEVETVLRQAGIFDIDLHGVSFGFRLVPKMFSCFN